MSYRYERQFFSCTLFWRQAEKEEIAPRLRVEEVVQFSSLQKYRRQHVGKLSVGLARLQGLARARCMKSKMMLLDEVSSDMNRKEKEDLSQVLLRIKDERNIHMIWIEHDVKLIGDLGDRLFVLQFGHKIAEGSPEEVRNNPRY